MTIGAIDHVNIHTRDLTATVAFYRDVLKMRVDQSIMGARGAWMVDAGGNPSIHIGLKEAYPEDLADACEDTGGGSVHHVAFQCTGYADVRARLEALGLLVSTNDVPTVGLRQLFLRDPNDVLLELNFRESA